MGQAEEFAIILSSWLTKKLDDLLSFFSSCSKLKQFWKITKIFLFQRLFLHSINSLLYLWDLLAFHLLRSKVNYTWMSFKLCKWIVLSVMRRQIFLDTYIEFMLTTLFCRFYFKVGDQAALASEVSIMVHTVLEFQLNK